MNLLSRPLSLLLPLAVAIPVGAIYAIIASSGYYKWAMVIYAGILGLGGLALFHILKITLRPTYLLGALYMTPILFDINFMYVDDPLFYVHANGYGITITDVLFGMLIFLWIMDGLAGKKGIDLQIPKPLKVAMAGLFIINALSTATTPHPFYALSMLWAQAKVYIIFWYLAKQVYSTNVIRWVIYTSAAIVATQGVIVLEQRLLGVIFTAELLGQNTTWASTIGSELVTRVSGTMGQPNALAMLMNEFMLITIFGMMVERHLGIKILLIIAILLAVIGEIFTASRGGWLSLATAFIVCFVMWLTLKRGYGFFSSVSLIGIVGSTLFGILFGASEAFRNRLTQDDAGTAEVRWPLMEVAQNLIAANPLTGVGLNHYTYFMQLYDRTFDAISFNYRAPVHNTYMLVAGEVGIPGSLLMIFILVSVLFCAYKVFRATQGYEAAFALGVFGGVLTWMLHNMVDPTSIYADYPFWILAGITVAMYTRMKLEKQKGAPLA
ncbi:MAG: O-antigen ligase family protein [Pontibacterium sp.]